jgi:hypothetical protein
MPLSKGVVIITSSAYRKRRFFRWENVEPAEEEGQAPFLKAESLLSLSVEHMAVP